MAEIKDKIITAESLSLLHEHNKQTYMPMIDPNCSGTMTMDGNGIFSGDMKASSITIGSNIKITPMGDRLEITFLDDLLTDEDILT